MKIVAVTSCPNGVAHTYMAAAKLYSAAEEQSVEIAIEKQGAIGVEDRLTDDEIKAADFVIIAASVNIQNVERFSGKRIFRCDVSLPIKHDKEIFNKALLEAKEEFFSNTNINFSMKSFIKENTSKGFFSAFSILLPFITSAMMLHILSDRFMSHEGFLALISNTLLVNFFQYTQVVSVALIEFAIPLFALYMCYIIAGRSAIAPGFIVALLISRMNIDTIGALTLAYSVSFIIVFINNKIKVNGPLNAIFVMFLNPFITIIITCILALVLTQIPFVVDQTRDYDAMIQNGIISSILLFATLTVWDLGGKVSKVALFLAIVFITKDNYVLNTIVQISIVVPTLGMALGTIIRRHKFSPAYRRFGYNALLMALAGVGEGAIPFSLGFPNIYVFRLLNIIGCSVACVIALYFGAINPVPYGGLLSIIFIENKLMYLVAILIGALTISTIGLIMAQILNLHETKRFDKMEKNENSSSNSVS